MNIQLRDFNAKLKRENIFKLAGNENYMHRVMRVALE
jgi:hypothetical protein